MRRLVKDLEQQRDQLVKKKTTPDSCQAVATRLSVSPDSSLPATTSNSISTGVSLNNYLQLSAEAEAFRSQNASMTEQLVERDLLYSVLRTGLLEFSQDSLNGEDPRFTPLTKEEGMACVRTTLQYINNARLLYANDESFQDRPTIFGWRQYCKRQGASINFAVKKSLPNVTPQQLAAATWRFITDSDVLNSLGPTQLKAYVSVVQKITDDVFVLDRRTEDGTRNLLRDGEIWCDIFYWMHYASEASGDSDPQMTASEFGGSNTYASEEFASSWLDEVLFLATRWETLVFPPPLLKHENITQL
ncbi:unnamed protein product [Phytophthora lilii]|uniref:Unnamed protein product n=1 Tax=Phytophthora lilii TaxID=2077276 RepID=A0A9W6WZI0_9STRA|nr:unnamed protein product [Phytophthora lilii]